MQKAQVWSLVRELRSLRAAWCGQKKKKKKKSVTYLYTKNKLSEREIKKTNPLTMQTQIKKNKIPRNNIN